MDHDLSVTAATLYGEARGEGLTGLLAVGCVIRNRVISPVRWWGTGWAGVCQAPWQFSCWNANDPNRAQLQDLVDDPPRGLHQTWDACVLAARAVMVELLPDITKGADHYCTKAVAAKTAWAKGKTPVASIGNHLFFKLH